MLGLEFTTITAWHAWYLFPREKASAKYTIRKIF